MTINRPQSRCWGSGLSPDGFQLSIRDLTHGLGLPHCPQTGFVVYSTYPAENSGKCREGQGSHETLQGGLLRF